MLGGAPRDLSSGIQRLAGTVISAHAAAEQASHRAGERLLGRQPAERAQRGGPVILILVARIGLHIGEQRICGNGVRAGPVDRVAVIRAELPPAEDKTTGVYGSVGLERT